MYTINLSNADAETLAGGGSIELTITGQAVSAPPAPPIETSPTVLKTVIVQNGVKNPTWVEDYSYSATDAVVAGGNGNASAVEVTTNGPWGGYQPSNAPGGSTSFASSTHLTVDINAPKGNSYSMQFLMAGDTAIDAPGIIFTKQKAGWETFTVAKAQVMTDRTKGDVSGEIYKGAIQSKQASAGDVFLIDNWGGV